FSIAATATITAAFTKRLVTNSYKIEFKNRPVSGLFFYACALIQEFSSKGSCLQQYAVMSSNNLRPLFLKRNYPWLLLFSDLTRSA
ncbi:hypothetical protein, partial [Pseudochrobactrum sp. AO18b]|uniref:hypothetical protein n=1 Tax=Pseudochrobactrum sp. AO18b TaxID=1201036 RepID=UPI001AEBD6F8